MSIAVCLIVRNEVYDIAEWVIHQFQIGFDELVVYDNISDDGTTEILNVLGETFPIRHIMWPTQDGGVTQYRAYEHCIATYRDTYDWICFIDADEFLIPLNNEKIGAMVAHYHHASAIALNWIIFGTSGLLSLGEKLVMEALTRRASLDFAVNKHVKTIVRPRLVSNVLNPHAFSVDGRYVNLNDELVVWEHPGLVEQGQIIHGNWHLHHYFLRTKEHWLRRLQRGQANRTFRPVEMFERYDRNEEIDESALTHATAVRAAIHNNTNIPTSAHRWGKADCTVQSTATRGFALTRKDVELNGESLTNLQNASSACDQPAVPIAESRTGSDGNKDIGVELGSFSSSQYWKNRYRDGGTSGAGSVGRLATYKANFLNAFVAINNIQSVIEFGSGDGTQLRLFDFPKYLGIDVSEKAIEISRKINSGNSKVEFLLESDVAKAYECELALSLDVIYHLVEDSAFEKYLRQLFYFGTRFVAIYSSDFERPWNAKHVRHRRFTEVVSVRFPEWHRIFTEPNPYPFDLANPHETSFSEFTIYGRLDASGSLVAIPPGG